MTKPRTAATTKDEPEPTPSATWSVYVVRCADGRLYTGIATDIARRFAEHSAGGRKSAKFLRGRGPLELVLQRAIGGHGEALRIEHRIKQLDRQHKERLLACPEPLDELIANLEPVDESDDGTPQSET